MAASRSTRVTRSTVGLNGLDESFCGRTLRNRSIAHPEEISSHTQVRSRSPKKRPEPVQIQKGNNNGRTTDIKQQNARESWEKSVAENGDSDTHASMFLDSRKEDGYINHNVPCTDSEVQVKLEDHKVVTACLPVEHVNQLTTEPATGPFSEIHSSLRDSEEEVDVVGDSSASKEQCNESTNNALDTSLESMPVSGEPEPSSVLDCVSTQMMSLSEPQEHRYTLRTSPRRAAPTRGSPTKNNSPCRENGQFEENNLNPSETNATVSDNISESLTNPGEVSHSEKGVCCDSENYGSEGLSKPSSEARLNIGHLPSAKESANPHITEEEDDDPDVYYFESDHVALKHNKDYQRLLQTIAVLEAQRSQAVQDLESLGRHQREALKNPIGFVEKLQKKADIGLPYPQRVVQLPEIVWDQYTSSLGNFEREFKNRKRHTRRVKLVFDKGLPARPKSPLDPRKDGESLSYSMLPLSDGPEGSNSRPQMIRGRLCDDTKPETFNQLWTVEEQKKLEQLLLKYPPEEVESRRWQKIADELGNRTAKQVASRVQKYFIKLTKAGIPVPGRTPNLYIYSKKSSTSRRQHPLNKHLFKPSTFMTSHEPPVYMDEDDDRSCFHSHMNTAVEEASDEESIPVAYRNLPEYKELLQFKKLKKQKLQQMQAESGFVQHVGFKCDNCGIEPIQGVRWHCQDCPPEMSLDFCDSCSDCLHETDIHKEDHQLEPVYRSETFLDRDYCVSQGTSYNYLDPNYFPANR
ncbi:ZZ-type zinc finger-containing protein 3 isoform X4 [Ovis canadensis]|uniref:ZZ-type zinc finger-containing protein 3 isoform X4 n=1 Tax=Ovis canadensis TaxID=37174 RepID=UPI003752A566